MTPDWDVVFLVFFAVSLLYGLLLKEKVVVTLLGAYVAMVVAGQWGEGAFSLVNQGADVLNQELVQGKISLVAVQIILFVLIILIVSFKGGVLVHPDSVGRGGWSYLIMAIYGLLTAALIASAVLSFLPAGTRDMIVLSSNIAHYIVDWARWWLLVPIALMLVVNFRGLEDR